MILKTSRLVLVGKDRLKRNLPLPIGTLSVDNTVSSLPAHPGRRHRAIQLPNPRDRLPIMQADEQQLPTGGDADANGNSVRADAHRERVPASCMKAFDSVYYCYSPFHQARQYYVEGQLDDCRGRVRRFRMCMMSRFRRQEVSELLYEQEEIAERKRTGADGDPVWLLRPEYVAAVQEADRADRKQREEGNAEADKELEKWWM